MNSTQTTLVLADDHPEVRAQVLQLLTSSFDVLDCVDGGFSLVAAARKFKPRVAVTDIRMHDLDGIEAARQLLHIGCCGAVVMLTMCNEAEMVSKAFAVGAKAYVLKVDASEELIPAIEAVLSGKDYVSSSVVGRKS